MDNFEIAMIIIAVFGTIVITIYYQTNQSSSLSPTIDNFRAVMFLLIIVYLTYIAYTPFNPKGKDVYSWSFLFDTIGKVGVDGNLSAYYGVLSLYFIIMGIIFMYNVWGIPILELIAYIFTFPIAIVLVAASAVVAN